MKGGGGRLRSYTQAPPQSTAQTNGETLETNKELYTNTTLMNRGHARAHKAKILFSWAEARASHSFVYSTIMLRGHRTEAGSPGHSSGPEQCVLKGTLSNQSSKGQQLDIM